MDAMIFLQKEEVSRSVLYDIFCQLAIATDNIHNNRIIHQDIKPENVLITRVRRYFQRFVVSSLLASLLRTVI